MADPLDLAAFLGRLRARWRVWAVAALAGAALGGGLSVLRPVRYVAEAHILIQPPPEAVGTFVMMSPSYLDSLQSYAVLAGGKTVRSRALASLSDSHRAGALEIEAVTPVLSRVVIVRGHGRGSDSALALARAAAEQTLHLASDTGAETLSLVDPGVPPEQPEDRNIPANALAAAFFALVAALVYESGRFLLERPASDD